MGKNTRVVVVVAAGQAESMQRVQVCPNLAVTAQRVSPDTAHKHQLLTFALGFYE